MSIRLIQSTFDVGLADVRDGADRLRQDRDDIDRRVRGFLGAGWTGVAAVAFAEAWDDWRAGADDVLDGLVAMGELLAAVQQDFVREDVESQQRLEAIAARIVDRLG